ncbi:hypothetical protein D7I39_13835 [Allopusillimonas ginsengisoli]|nr:hypothetical protein D7I39_13835 [Allopusillimonas ginsengisoli]
MSREKRWGLDKKTPFFVHTLFYGKPMCATEGFDNPSALFLQGCFTAVQNTTPCVAPFLDGIVATVSQAVYRVRAIRYRKSAVLFIDDLLARHACTRQVTPSTRRDRCGKTMNNELAAIAQRVELRGVQARLIHSKYLGDSKLIVTMTLSKAA